MVQARPVDVSANLGELGCCRRLSGHFPDLEDQLAQIVQDLAHCCVLDLAPCHLQHCQTLAGCCSAGQHLAAVWQYMIQSYAVTPPHRLA